MTDRNTKMHAVASVSMFFLQCTIQRRKNPAAPREVAGELKENENLHLYERLWFQPNATYHQRQ